MLWYARRAARGGERSRPSDTHQGHHFALQCDGARAGTDLTDKSSWDKVRFWVREVKEREPNCALYVCGTKEDMLEDHPRAIDEAVVAKFCADNQAQYYETSSRLGSNVDALFRSVAELFVRTHAPAARTEPPADGTASRASRGQGQHRAG